VRSLFDVNFLVAMFDEDHIHHERAHQWWDANRADGWASCPLTQNGFVRVLSQSTTRTKVSPPAALDLLRTATGEEGHVFWPDDISLVDIRRFNSTRILGPKQLTDVYLVGLAVKNGGRLTTFDRSISRSAVVGAELHNLVVV
jgi:toxin-antitoxin system PIN domain toxin